MSDESPGDDVGDDVADDVVVEHDPTIAYHPEALVQASADEAVHIAGAFGFALVIERGPRAGLTYVLPAGETLAGRGADSGIFLGDVTVSRSHARFTVAADGLVVEDLGSTNGTYVNGHRVDRANLHPGDEVLIGKFRLVVAQGDV